jgi:hypothetical protein
VKPLTTRETLRLMLDNDARNLSDVKRLAMTDKVAVVVSDCAVRYFDALQFAHENGAGEEERRATDNLREATALYREWCRP